MAVRPPSTPRVPWRRSRISLRRWRHSTWWHWRARCVAGLTCPLHLTPSPLTPHRALPFTVLALHVGLGFLGGATSFPARGLANRLVPRFVLDRTGSWTAGWFDLRQTRVHGRATGSGWFAWVSPSGKVHCRAVGAGVRSASTSGLGADPVPGPALMIGQNLPRFRVSPGSLRTGRSSDFGPVRGRGCSFSSVAGCWSVGSRGGS